MKKQTFQNKIEAHLQTKVCWTAPEVFRGEHYSEKVDVYSFAICFYELATGLEPFEELTTAQILAKVVYNGGRPDIPINMDVPEDVVSLMQKCWRDDPKVRPEFKEIVPELEKIVEDMDLI